MVTWEPCTPAPGVVVYQPAKGGPGYRYSNEIFWLVGFALEGGIPGTALDLGTGSGVGAWLLAGHGVQVEAVDAWPGWQEGWARTARDSTVLGTVRTRIGDVADGLVGPSVDLVVANPPYWPATAGRVAKDPWRRAARTPSTATPEDFARLARRRAGASGRVCVVVPQAHEESVVAALGGVRRRVAVGDVLVVLEAGGSAPIEDAHLSEAAPRVQDWISRARRMEHA